MTVYICAWQTPAKRDYCLITHVFDSKEKAENHLKTNGFSLEDDDKWVRYNRQEWDTSWVSVFEYKVE